MWASIAGQKSPENLGVARLSSLVPSPPVLKEVCISEPHGAFSVGLAVAIWELRRQRRGCCSFQKRLSVSDKTLAAGDFAEIGCCKNGGYRLAAHKKRWLVLRFNLS